MSLFHNCGIVLYVYCSTSFSYILLTWNRTCVSCAADHLRTTVSWSCERPQQRRQRPLQRLDSPSLGWVPSCGTHNWRRKNRSLTKITQGARGTGQQSFDNHLSLFYHKKQLITSCRQSLTKEWVNPNDMYRLDGDVVGVGMGLFLIVGHWPKILPQNSKGARGQLNVCTVYVVLFSPLKLKFVLGWLAISVSSWQQ